jgi:hypothetical protein
VFLIDDLLLLPLRGALWAARQVAQAADAEMSRKEKDIVTELEDLHRLLESGGLSEAEFDRREGELLDLLDALRAKGAQTE